MKISLNNISKIEKADIEIKGITVIAGENNTGKSTVGKALWSIFNSFYNIEEELKKEREELLYFNLENYLRLKKNMNVLPYDASLKIIDELYARDIENIVDIKNILAAEFEPLNDYGNLPEESVTELAEKLYEILKLEDKYILKTHLQSILLSEFNGQVNNIYNREAGEIELTIGDKINYIEISNQKIKNELEDNLNLQTKAIYIDDPYVLDAHLTQFDMNHKRDLKRLLDTKKEKNMIENALLEKSLEKINQKLDKVFEEMIFIFDAGKVRLKNSFEDLNIKNLSTGLKTFVILKNLISNGILEKKGTLILDEPEIHLHPEWQLLFAEIIVLLQKELDLHILLTTHSPYFLRAIQVYAGNYEIADKCKYYLAENKGNLSIIKDVTNEIDLIYKKLAAPLQRLEDLMYE